MDMKHFLKSTVLFLALVVFLFSLAPSAAYAQQATLEQPKELTVHDNNGKKVGDASGAGPGSPSVAFQITPPPNQTTIPLLDPTTNQPATNLVTNQPVVLPGPLVVVFMVGKNRFFGSGGPGQIVFEQPNCTTQPFFSFGPPGGGFFFGDFFLGPIVQLFGRTLLTQPFSADPDLAPQTIFTPDPTQINTPQTITVQSQLSPAFGGPAAAQSCFNAGTPPTGFPAFTALAVRALSLGINLTNKPAPAQGLFTPPFSLRAKFEVLLGP